MSARYVREHYGVPAKRGTRVTFTDHDGSRGGVIVSFPDQYIGVRFDGERRTSRLHPTWGITYQAAQGSDR